MSVAKVGDLLRDHVGHRACLVEQPGRLLLKCVDCTRLLDLTALLKAAESTSTSQLPLGLNDDHACPTHPGEPATSCGRCRSELIAQFDAPPPLSLVRTGADPTQNAEWQAARARFGKRP